ncbi:MAG: glycoside hydrolase family 9 protein [Acetatifactor sp.]|nr:glycoside hydrolase family 9 protein [Acetatifactor sp.]
MVIRRAVLPGLCLAAFLCAGCNLSSTVLPDSEGGRVTSMESTPIVDYAVPKLVPNVLVDVAGYRSEGYKRAAVKGRRLPKTFDLVDAQTGEIVFTGTLERGEYNAEQEMYSAYADFNEWEQEGSYYLECEYIGRSYTFVLEEGLYNRLFAEICQGLMTACREQTVTLEDINRILLAYEWYGEVFLDDNGDTIPDALEAVADWIEATGEQPVPEGQEATYAAVLAKFSYLYQKYDRQYATECLKRASVVFDQTQSTMQEDAESFHALVELYRATGLNTYGSQIEEYKTYFENHTGFAEADGYLYGAMTYINTRQPVDRELCRIFIDSIMEHGETISELYGELLHPVTPHNNGAPDLLRHAWELACANYVMNNYQYNHVMEEFLHYLRGRNALSVDFYAQETEETSRYLLILTQLLAVQENLKE